jgi:hypothetical protein
MAKISSRTGLIVVSPEMERAGLECVRELAGQDICYIVRSIYMAMEYERLDLAGQLSRLDENPIQISQT